MSRIPSEVVEVALRDMLDMLERQAGDVLHAEAVDKQPFAEMRELITGTARASESAIRRHAPNLLPRLQRLLQNMGSP